MAHTLMLLWQICVFWLHVLPDVLLFCWMTISFPQLREVSWGSLLVGLPSSQHKGPHGALFSLRWKSWRGEMSPESVCTVLHRFTYLCVTFHLGIWVCNPGSTMFCSLASGKQIFVSNSLFSLDNFKDLNMHQLMFSVFSASCGRQTLWKFS